MDFDLSPEQAEIRKLARDFADREIAPGARERDREETFPGDILKKMGLNAEIQAGDWGTLITRRAVKEPVDKGGWSIFHTWLVGPDMVNPAVEVPVGDLDRGRRASIS